jgi:serine/threonine-protein kinase
VKVCTACGVEYPDEVLFCQRDGTPLRSAEPTKDLVGQVVADRYHVLKKLGEGGMGQVYLAEHVKMGRRCAIKIMSAGMINDPDAISRFNREAANASRISHPNVCAIYDFGETKDGLIYLAMEFIEGRSLSDLLHETGPLQVPRAAKILTQCADALQAAHDLGIIHRDLKPDNIMVITAREKDTVKVVDFGIAKATGTDPGAQKVTRTGLVVGTPEYMSPEQLSGDPLDGRSDLYSLGLVFYRMITGALPFRADSAQETMIKRLTDEPIPLSQAKPDGHFPTGLQAVMDRALARWPNDRFGSATEFARSVSQATAGLTASVDTEGVTQVVRPGDLRRQTPATRVDPSVTAPQRAPVAQRSTPARPGPAAATPARRFPLLPVAAVATLLALGGGAYAARGLLFGGAAGEPDSLVQTRSGVAGRTGGGGTGEIRMDTTTHPTPAGGGTGTRSRDSGRTVATTPPPVTRKDSAAPQGGGPVTTGGDAPDTVALRGELDAIFEDLGVAAKRTAARQRAEQIFGLARLPIGLKAEAAQLVGQGYLEEGRYPEARDWYSRALAIQPKPSWQDIYDKIPR